MKNLLLIIFITCVVFHANSQTLSPHVQASAGSHFASDEISLSWTLGETVTETFTAQNIILTQGFHQSEYIITEIEDIKTDVYTITAFPNPVTDVINLKLELNTGEPVVNHENLIIELIDIQGKKIVTTNFKNTIEQINISTLSNNLYLLGIYSEKRELIKIFKVQKAD